MEDYEYQKNDEDHYIEYSEERQTREGGQGTEAEAGSLDADAQATFPDIMKHHRMMPLNQLFNGLDREFMNIKTLQDDIFSYHGSVLVQTVWELPIIIQWPDSRIRFTFSTLQGDISFGIVFVAALEEGQEPTNMAVETLEEMGVVPSSTEEIGGHFAPPAEGVLHASFIVVRPLRWYDCSLCLRFFGYPLNQCRLFSLCGTTTMTGPQSKH